MGACPLFGTFKPARVDKIKLVYDANQLNGRLNLPASACNQLDQYTSSPLLVAVQNSPFSSLVTTVGTHCTYPQRVGQAELAWVAGYVPR